MLSDSSGDGNAAAVNSSNVRNSSLWPTSSLLKIVEAIVGCSLKNQVAAPDVLLSTPFRDPLLIVCEECLREPRLTGCFPAILYGFLSATTKRSQSLPANHGRVEILI